MHIVRSPHAHARITGIDTEAARHVPGVLGAFTQADLQELGPIPCQVAVATNGPMLVPSRYALASDRVRYVGEPVAFAVAETRMAARDAAEMVSVEYDPLPCVTDARAALQAGRPTAMAGRARQSRLHVREGDRGAVASAMTQAAEVVDLDLVNNRIIIAALEHRGAVGRFDPAAGSYDLVLSAAGVHGIRDALADKVFRVERAQIRVSAPDVGGGFGVKNAVYPEYVMLLWAARRLGRPVRWASEHGEDFVSTAHGRDNLTRARLALDAEGRFLALEVDNVANLGAAMSTGGPGSSTNAPGNAMGGGYAFPAVYMHVRGAFTNTVPTDAYRGAGKPEANYLLERLIDAAATRLGIDRIELRRRNLAHEFPRGPRWRRRSTAGRFAANIDPALEAAGYAGFPARRAEARARGCCAGSG